MFRYNISQLHNVYHVYNMYIMYVRMYIMSIIYVSYNCVFICAYAHHMPMDSLLKTNGIWVLHWRPLCFSTHGVNWGIKCAQTWILTLTLRETLGGLFFPEPRFDDKLMTIITSLQSIFRSQNSNSKARSILSCIVDTGISRLLQ